MADFLLGWQLEGLDEVAKRCDTEKTTSELRATSVGPPACRLSFLYLLSAGVNHLGHYRLNLALRTLPLLVPAEPFRRVADVGPASGDGFGNRLGLIVAVVTAHWPIGRDYESISASWRAK
jgi:hypothetical protein